MNDLEIEMFNGYDLSEYDFKGMDVYYLDDGIIYDNENDNSLFSYFKLYDFSYLNGGDASREQELNIIKKYDIKNVDLLKVGHHGSKTSSDDKFIDLVKPKYSIVSVGKNNRYGHPNKEVLDNLENSKIYRTDRDGSIIFEIKKNKLNIETRFP